MKPTTAKVPSHYETYKGWSVAVQVSAHMSRIDTNREDNAYIPRIIVTEHIGTDFKDKEVPDGHSYPTPEACIAQGILTARDYICLLYTSPSPRDKRQSRMPSSA